MGLGRVALLVGRGCRAGCWTLRVSLPTRCAARHRCRTLQECVYHKAVIDKKSPNVLARLAKQVGWKKAESVPTGKSGLRGIASTWFARIHWLLTVECGMGAGSATLSASRGRPLSHKHYARA